jgi:catalase-peroxidase
VDAQGRLGAGTVPDAHDPSKRHAPMMSTTDLALRMDPAYEKIARRFRENPQELADAFAKAWYKLTHRDMGPLSRYLGPLVPARATTLAGSDTRAGSPIDRRAGHRRPEGQNPRLRTVDFATGHDGLGVCGNFPRQRQARWSERRAYSPGTAEGLGSQPAGRAGEGAHNWKRSRRNSTAPSPAGRRSRLPTSSFWVAAPPSRKAARRAGHDVQVPFSPGRMDASQEQTDVDSFAVLEPTSDGFRNYIRKGDEGSAAELLVDKAQLMTLTAPEMTVLIGGMRALNANFGQSGHGVFTQAARNADQ